MRMQEEKVLVLAHYLPQFHPIPENNEWWGPGFTEWTNTAKAKPLYWGHYQPHLPADLGYYDLRVPEVREAQAEMARDHGITGFCYWHYWFGNGQRLLERPFNEVLQSGKPDFPFCLAWANQSWTGVWHGLKDKILIEQRYPGREDYIRHFNEVLPAFQDERYIKIGKKPVFVVYSPQLVPDSIEFTSTWNELAIKNGFEGIYFIGIHYVGWDHRKSGYNDKTIHQPSNYIHIYERIMRHRVRGMIHRNLFKFVPDIYHYDDLVKYYDFKLFEDKDIVPTIIPGWDNTPRSGKKGWVFHGSTPESFGQHFDNALQFTLRKKGSKPPIIFIKSWNEWAEGNYLEPDQRYGMSYLAAIKKVMEKHQLI